MFWSKSPLHVARYWLKVQLPYNAKNGFWNGGKVRREGRIILSNFITLPCQIVFTA